MIDELKPYFSTKDSGVEWIGAVPAHWGVRRLRSVASILNGATPSTGREEYWDGNILWVTPDDLGALQGERVIDSARKITAEGHASCGTSLAPPKSIVLSTRAPIGHLGILESAGCTNQGCKLLVPTSDIAPEYLHALLQSARAELQSLGQGTTFAELSRAKLASFRLSIPPLSEQTAIARFLDCATGRIKRYIRAKEKLIALLEEQKQVIVHDAVTGRIDVRTGKSYPAYKPSGAEWLGDVPVHWEVRRLKWVTHLQRGYDLPSDNRLPGSVPVVSSGGIIDTHVESRCAGPGIVLGRYGSTDAVFFIDEDFWPHNTSLFVTDFRGNHRKWCFYLLQTIAKGEHAGKSAVPGIDRKDLFQVVVPLPPVEVQQEISDRIDSVVHQLSIAISQERGQIDLLREYRTRLIADVVTGKLDVREAASAHT